ncbi:MAG: hypothetical protein Q4B08_14705, partial [Propionibacteriaceae bacterium]|nr:hypothetical protein [Propionibacteriaceae bacterium]
GQGHRFLPALIARTSSRPAPLLQTARLVGISGTEAIAWARDQITRATFGPGLRPHPQSMGTPECADTQMNPGRWGPRLSPPCATIVARKGRPGPAVAPSHGRTAKV